MGKSIHSSLIEEEEDLYDKYSNLLIYSGSKEYYKLNQRDQRLIIEQIAYMSNYLNVLRLRIKYLEESKQNEIK